jgi:hypothetical protein
VDKQVLFDRLQARVVDWLQAGHLQSFMKFEGIK